MPVQTVDVLIEGGKATAAPPLGPALGPTGLNIGQVVAKINEVTQAYKGMQVPVKVHANTDDKTFEIEIGTPPASALIKKEAGVEKGSGSPHTDKVADLAIEQVIKIALMKEGKLLGADTKQKVLEIVGTCQSMGVMVEGMAAPDAIAAIKAGKYDSEITSRKTEISAEEKAALDAERKKLAAEMAARHDEFVAKGKAVMASMEGKEKSAIRKAMEEAGLPQAIIDELAPVEKAAEPGKK